MIQNSLRSLALIALVSAAGLCVAGSSLADELMANTLPEVEIDRDVDELVDVIRPRPKDVDVADTVLVFTSTNVQRRPVRCVAIDRTGTAIGRTIVRVPANGVKYILASDLANGRDFVGHVRCWTSGHFLPTALFLGPEITDLPARVGSHEGHTNIRFPLVATY